MTRNSAIEGRPGAVVPGTAGALSVRREVIRILNQELTPWLRSQTPRRLTLFNPPGARPVRDGGTRAGTACQGSPALPPGTNAKRFPCLAFVVKGPAEFWTAGPDQNEGHAARPEALPNQGAGFAITAVAGPAFFVFAPGAPVPDGTQAHVASQETRISDGLIFWLLVTPGGALCHFCRTDNGRHAVYPALFAGDPQLSNITNLLMEELAKPRVRSGPAAEALLTVLAIRLEETLSEARMHVSGHSTLAPFEETTFAAKEGGLKTDTEKSLQTACLFIRTHFHEDISPSDVAANAYVSVSHLNRIFRRDLKMSPMQFVTQCRVEAARPLLAETTLTIENVGNLTGFSDASHFSHVFRRIMGSSPLEYRQRAQSAARKTGGA